VKIEGIVPAIVTVIAGFIALLPFTPTEVKPLARYAFAVALLAWMFAVSTHVMHC
jgi:hypothetical protein